ncbi:MAG TPA: DUF4434 domain-containing protein [Clostridiaceae bacterium]|nr:DUF4434 domain-containing protein [Clostridiaceae bacterium]
MLKRFTVTIAVILTFLFAFISGLRYYIKPYSGGYKFKKLNTESVMIFAEQDEFNFRPIAGGTFIQWWLVKDWDDEKWTSELNILKEAGMEYIVLTPTAFYKADKVKGEGRTYTLYPSSSEGFEVMQDGSGNKYHDIVDACLRNAEKAGMKVFLGLNFSEDWWSKRRDVDWIFARMREGNTVADELWDLYRDKYPNAFYGWYWTWEVDNGYFKNLDFSGSKRILANAIKIHLDHFDATGKHLPFMLAPYMDWRLGTPRGYAKMWEYVFENSGLKEGDIFCPQDSIGAGGLNKGNYAKWFSELKKAVDTKPGLRFWADIETFDIHDWTSITINDFVEKMEKLQPYVENFIAFSYSHYYSPNITNPGFHETYLDYVMNGIVENNPPSAPESVAAHIEGIRTVILNWNPSEDDTGVCGYYVYRNGVLIANNQVKRKDGTEGTETAPASLRDTLPEKGKEFVYEVQAYDFAGNLSEKSDKVMVIAE